MRWPSQEAIEIAIQAAQQAMQTYAASPVLEGTSSASIGSAEVMQLGSAVPRPTAPARPRLDECRKQELMKHSSA